jgi:cytochrome P450 family 142 subfamily A polypeptide 1
MVNVDVPFLASSSWREHEMRERMRWLRHNDPVRWSEPDGLWLISKFEDVAFISKNQGLFTSEKGVRPGNDAKLGLIDEGEPRHAQLRALINKGFTPRMVTKLEHTFRYLTKKAIDAVAPVGECDFVKSISVPLPLWLIAAMIGIPEEDYERFHEWSDRMVAADGNFDKPDVTARAVAAYMEYAAYVTRIIEDRRREPKDDLVSILTGAKDQGLLQSHIDESRDQLRQVEGADVELANDELIMLLVVLLVAGNETTRNGISGGMQLLIENPGERDKLIADPGLIRGAVEEMVRLVSPVHCFSRTVTRDTELRGRALKEGQRVLLLYPSANRDEDVFPDADAFRVERNPHHLGFGIGSHYCMGANLARMEMRVVFEEILRRLPDMEYAGDGPVIRPSALVRTCEEMQVRYTPEGQIADAA